jgi:hypothetical protein
MGCKIEMVRLTRRKTPVLTDRRQGLVENPARAAEVALVEPPPVPAVRKQVVRVEAAARLEGAAGVAAAWMEASLAVGVRARAE